MTPLVADEVLDEIVRTVWTTMLGIVPADGPGDDADLDRAEPSLYTGCCQITGAWSAAVVIECPAPLARAAAAIMLGIEPSECTPLDLQDVVGELANVTSGNVKSLTTGCQLSLPSVAEGDDYLVMVPRSRLVASATVSCAGTPFRATVHERA